MCVCVWMRARVRVIEAFELSVEDSVARPICPSTKRVGDVRCVVSDRRLTNNR